MPYNFVHSLYYFPGIERVLKIGKYIDLTTKKTVGKPRCYTPVELKEGFYNFIVLCRKYRHLPTVPGFKVFLNISKSTYNNYENNPEYMDVFSHIYNYLEHVTINCKYRHIGDRILISLLRKYHKYFDKQEAKYEIECNTKIDLSPLSMDELKELIEYEDTLV